MKSFSQFLTENKFSIENESEFELGRGAQLEPKIKAKLIKLYLADPEATEPADDSDFTDASRAHELKYNPYFEKDLAGGRIKRFNYDKATGEIHSLNYLSHIADWIRADPNASVRIMNH